MPSLPSNHPNRPPYPVLTSTILNFRSVVHQHLTNASINVAPYDNDEFRLQQVEQAIHHLNELHSRLLAQVTVATAKKV